VNAVELSAEAAAPATIRTRSPWADAWRRLRKNRMAVVCGSIFTAIVLFSFLGPIVAAAVGRDGVTQEMPIVSGVLGPATMVEIASPPSLQHWMGTDTLGRDMLVRTMEGGRIAILVSLAATLVALLIGVTWGAVSAYAGGKVDEVMMRIVDVLYGFPNLVFVIVVAATLQSKNIVLLFALIGAIQWLTMARIVRGQVLSLRNRDFVEAARCLGVPTRRILFRHIVPNCMSAIIVYATLQIPAVMLTEAVLSFLGVGVQAPRASWGTLVTEGVSQIAVYPWVLIGPGLVMSLTIFALNFLGDGLRDALDPQMRKD
jgi:oligopeptide transport system permease protein